MRLLCHSSVMCLSQGVVQFSTIGRHLFLVLVLVLSADAQTFKLQGTLAPLASFPGLQFGGMTATASGEVTVAGVTASFAYPATANAVRKTHTTALCPVIGPFPPLPCLDGYVAKVAKDGTLLYGSYFDVTSISSSMGVAADATGAIFVS